MEVLILLMIHLLECVDLKEDVDLTAHKLIIKINDSKILVKYISYNCKCKFCGRKHYSS